VLRVSTKHLEDSSSDSCQDDSSVCYSQVSACLNLLSMRHVFRRLLYIFIRKLKRLPLVYVISILGVALFVLIFTTGLMDINTGAGNNNWDRIDVSLP
jgi:hypothetical protein